MTRQYAEFSGLSVGRVLNLSEEGANNAVPLYGNRIMVNQFKLEEASFARADAATVPSGQLEVTTRISAVFLPE